MVITRDRPNRSLHLSQEGYIRNILTDHGMLEHDNTYARRWRILTYIHPLRRSWAWMGRERVCWLINSC